MAMYNEITVTAELTNTEYIITKNYNLLENKPQINSVELIGNKSLEDLGINPDAEENVIDVVKVNGSALTPDEEKAVNVTVTTGSDNGTVKVNGSDVAVKGLKSAAFTEATAYDAAGSAAEVQGNVDALTVVVNGKVDKVQGKGLSQNDFTNAYKSKLDGIEAGAQVNAVTSVAGKTGAVTLQKSDVGLGNVDNTSDLNKPISTATQNALDGKVDKVEGKGLSTEDFTAEEKTKLAGIEDGAEVNVQADWNQTDVNADDYIKNKPEIGDAAYAEHLALTTPINNNAPYLFRAFPVRNAFKENLKSIVGGTVVWNQLVDYTIHFPSRTNNGITFTNNNDGSIKISGEASDIASTYDEEFATNVNNRVFLIKGQYIQIKADGVSVIATNTEQTIIKVTSATSLTMRFRVASGTNLSAPYMTYPQIIDLTAMFGSTIADYIYSLEQATAGSGVAYFRSLFPKDYYAYNAGQLMSVKALSHKMVGFNQWDEQYEAGTFNQTTGEKTDSSSLSRSKNPICVLENTTYYFKRESGACRIFFYDGSMNLISSYYTTSGNTTFTTPTNCSYINFAMTNSLFNNDICINLHWDGERDGEYEAYSEHIYPLDSDLELRGIPKLDSNNNLYYDGDTYESDGTVTRKYAEVDLGSLEWNKYTPSGNVTNTFFYATGLTNCGANGTTTTAPTNILSNYSSLPRNNIYSGNFNEGVDVESNGSIYILDTSKSSLTAEQFKTAMNGVKLVYEVATLFTETADTFQNLQIVDDFGTEEFVDNRDVPIPVGNDTDFTQEIHIASLPTADGTYNATLTMSNGIATMSFVSTS